MTYADQTEKDWRELVRSMKSDNKTKMSAVQTAAAT
jgi:hypothetical protein